MSSFAEGDQSEIPIPGIDGPTLKTIIDYCYSCDIEINKENAERIMVAASSLQLVELVEKCTDFWIEKVDAGSCVDFMMVAEKYNMKKLWEKSLSCICTNFDRIAAEDTVRIDEKNFAAILREDDITASEDNIFDCFSRWIEHDTTNRAKLAPTLSNCIRLEHVSKEVNGHVLNALR